MIFVQFLYNFLSHTHIIFYSLSSFFSLLFLTNKKREKQSYPKSWTKIVVQISLLIYLIVKVALFVHNFKRG